MYVCLLFCGPTDSSCKCRPLMMSQLPSESTCQGGRQRIWTCCFLTGKGVSAVDQFKYVDGEGLLSTSLPHCCASVHEAGSFFQLSYVSFDMYNFLVRGKKKSCHCALQMEENEELRRAHDKRRERLCLIQTNYKTVRDQLKEMEKSNGLWVHCNRLSAHTTY